MFFKIKLFIYLFLISLVVSCSHNNSEINDPRYSYHTTYKSFLNYIKEGIDTIKSESQKIAYIRQKTAELIDAGIGTRDIELFDENWVSWSGKDYYHTFLQNLGTVKCGGSAHFLKQVYQDLGFESKTYDMGCPGVFTHQVTLVKLSDGEYYIQDAHYNMTFEDERTNQLISFEDMLLLLFNEEGEYIRPEIGKYEYTPTWDTTNFQVFIESHPFARKLIDSIGLDNLPNYSPDRYSTAMMAFSLKQIHDNCLGKTGLPNELKYMYMIPNEETKQEEIIEIIEEVIEKSSESND